MDVQKLHLLIAALVIGFVVFPTLSKYYDEWMSDTQEQILENERKQEAQRAEQVQQQQLTLRGEICQRHLDGICEKNETVADIETCLQMLRLEHCDEHLGIDLCATVEETDTCRAPRNRALEDVCGRLRHAAGCSEAPAPASRSAKRVHNWTISAP